MGNTFEVSEWWAQNLLAHNYKYHSKWMGESLLKALWIMWKLKRAGAGCVKLEWR